ncbi:hypothetical protein PV325_002119 [Microctonus aethiopoides]|nr:hypothetical protein PV325_002119 [Microctonus aethiopoides]KAK0097731.1 hypothetical protein PV326_014171 [Microctonus aethiopoides]
MVCALWILPLGLIDKSPGWKLLDGSCYERAFLFTHSSITSLALCVSLAQHWMWTIRLAMEEPWVCGSLGEASLQTHFETNAAYVLKQFSISILSPLPTAPFRLSGPTNTSQLHCTAIPFAICWLSNFVLFKFRRLE